MSDKKVFPPSFILLTCPSAANERSNSPHTAIVDPQEVSYCIQSDAPWGTPYFRQTITNVVLKSGHSFFVVETPQKIKEFISILTSGYLDEIIFKVSS